MQYLCKTQKSMKNKIFPLLLTVLFSSLLQAGQTDLKDSLPSLPTERWYLNSVSLALPVYRDFATSPLFYSGLGLSIDNQWIQSNARRDHRMGFDFLFGFALSDGPKSDYFQAGGESFLTALTAYYEYLRPLPKYRGEDFKWKVGAGGVLTQNVRGNLNLQNAGLGLESLGSLMGISRWEWDVSRKTAKEKKCLFVKKWKEPQKRSLAFQLNAGLLNFNYRPGYNYVDFPNIDGTLTNNLQFLLDGYQWSMNGYRLGTRIELSRFYRSGNGVRISYLWDVIHAPGQHQSFQMATHRIQTSMIINNRKNK
jgi:hypothetical protein